MTNAVVTINGAPPALPTLLGQGAVAHPRRRQDSGGHQGAHQEGRRTSQGEGDLRARRCGEPLVRGDRARDQRGRARAQDAAHSEERAVVHRATRRLLRIRRSPSEILDGVRRGSRRRHETALPLSGRVPGRHVAGGDAARARRVGGEREEVLERVHAGRPGALLQVLRAGADGRHRASARSASSAGARPRCARKTEACAIRSSAGSTRTASATCRAASSSSFRASSRSARSSSTPTASTR